MERVAGRRGERGGGKGRSCRLEALLRILDFKEQWEVNERGGEGRGERHRVI